MPYQWITHDPAAPRIDPCFPQARDGAYHESVGCGIRRAARLTRRSNLGASPGGSRADRRAHLHRRSRALDGTGHGCAGWEIVFVGAALQANAWIGPETKVERLGGRLVLPGLVDSHIHASMISDIDVCDLKSREMTLREIAAFAADCIEHYHIPEGEWLSVHQWNYAKGNQPDPVYRTLRAALDEASATRPIELRGNDGHHNAFNSMALARAKNRQGIVVGLSKATLAADFASLEAIRRS